MLLRLVTRAKTAAENGNGQDRGTFAAIEVPAHEHNQNKGKGWTTSRHKEGLREPGRPIEADHRKTPDARRSERQGRDREEDAGKQEKAAIAHVAAVVPAAGVGRAVGIDETAHIHDGDAPAKQTERPGSGPPEQKPTRDKGRSGCGCGGSGPSDAHTRCQTGRHKGEDSQIKEALDADELISIQVLCQTAAAVQLPGHPAVEERKHWAYKEQGVEDVMTAIERNQSAADRNHNGTGKQELKEHDVSCPRAMRSTAFARPPGESSAGPRPRPPCETAAR